MRRSIFSMNTISGVVANIPPVSNAGSNLSLVGDTNIDVDGSSSYDIDGTIVTYLWTEVTAFGVTFTDNSSPTTNVQGLSTVDEEYILRLTVTDNDGASHSDDISIFTSASVQNDLIMSSSIPIGGSGTLDFIYGEPYEVIYLDFSLIGTSSGDSIDFSGANVGVLDDLHTFRTGSVTLLSDGTLSKNYSSTGSAFDCLVVITNRSSAEPLPINRTTLISL